MDAADSWSSHPSPLYFTACKTAHIHTGSSHDQFQGLPSNMDLSRTVFGTSTLKEESAGSIVSPQKSSSEVEKEYNVGKELYKKVHVKKLTLLSPIHPQP